MMSIKDVLFVLVIVIFIFLFTIATFDIAEGSDRDVDVDLSATERTLIGREIAEQIERKQRRRLQPRVYVPREVTEDRWREMQERCGRPVNVDCVHRYYNERFSGYDQLLNR